MEISPKADDLKIEADFRLTRLQSLVKSLRIGGALDVWDKATSEEREKLASIILRKMIRFRKTGHMTLTQPEQDRINIRLAKLVNDIQQAAGTCDE
jgi:hypothetical protein